MSTRRSAELPDVPTTGEAGLPNLVVNIWYGLMAPQGTLPSIVDQLQREVVNGLARPDIRAHLVNTSVEPVGSTPAEFSALGLAERARWAAVIRSANISIAP